MMIDPAQLLGVAIAKLSMSPTDVLLVFCPSDWTLEQVDKCQGWMRIVYPQINLMFVPGDHAAVVNADHGEQLRMLLSVACVPPSLAN